MLHELRLRDFALIDRLAIEFGPGLNAITGETGSGKSLVVTALELLAGARPRGGVGAWVRAGAQRAVLEAVFEPPAPDDPTAALVDAWFERHLPEFGGGAWREEDELLVARVLDGGGRSRARVLGSAVRLGALAELVGLLLEVNGQFEQRAVLDGARQTAWFDEIVAGAAWRGDGRGAGPVDGDADRAGLLARRADYRGARDAWLATRRACAEVEERALQRDGRATFLRLALEELEALAPRPGEGSELRRERELLRQSERVVSELGTTAAELSEGDAPIVARVAAIADRVARWSNAAEPLHDAAEELSTGLLHLENAASALVSFLSDVEADPGRLDHVETRLEHLERAARRHGFADAGGVDRLAAHTEELRREADELEDLDAALERARTREDAALAVLREASGALTAARRARTEDFVAAVAPLLDQLGLGRAELRAEFVRATSGPDADAPSAQRYGPSGEEEVQLSWRPNPGEPARPLAHIASGGEAARVFLALRCAAAAGAGARAGSGSRAGSGGGTVSSAGTGSSARRSLVFDEVDAAVGGRLAPRVAECLARLASGGDGAARSGAQVVTVTHQPAIAARADRHLAVVKRTRAGRTVARAVLLEGTARLSEVAAMIAGSGRSPAARAEARRLLATGPAPVAARADGRPSPTPGPAPRRTGRRTAARKSA